MSTSDYKDMVDWTEGAEQLTIPASDVDKAQKVVRDAAIKPATDFFHKIRDVMRGEGEMAGFKTPFTSMDDKFRFKPGKITLVGGYTGVKKSMFTCLLSNHFTLQGARNMIASLEMNPEETLARMTRMAACNPLPSDRMLARYLMWLLENEKFFIFDHVDTMPTERALNLARYAATELGVKVLILDNLMMLEDEADNYTSQKKMVKELMVICKTTGLHIVLVAHLKKPEGFKKAGVYDIYGSSNIPNIVDNIFILSSNEKKEAELQKGYNADELILEQPDLFLSLKKHRGEKWKGTKGLWFDDRSLQMKESANARPFEYWKRFWEDG